MSESLDIDSPDRPIDDDGQLEPLPIRSAKLLDTALIVLLSGYALTLRIVQHSPLWLDEALSVNIASLPISEIASQLRHDGHPPLYYWLLHLWMEVFGDSNLAVRSMSGLIALALFPLCYFAAKRIGGTRAAVATILLIAFNPFVVRYSTEARMYALVMVLAVAGWLLIDGSLKLQTRPKLFALALVTATMLWTHYWAVWLCAGTVLGLMLRGMAFRHDPIERRKVLGCLGAIGVGVVAFTPWLGSLLYQSSHTGTPWAEPSLPFEVLSSSILGLGGGTTGESVLLGISLSVAGLLGFFGSVGPNHTVALSMRPVAGVRRLLFVTASTLAIATTVSYLAGAAFAVRYLAVIAPLVLVVCGVGLGRVTHPLAFRTLVAVMVGLALISSTRSAVSKPRTQADQVVLAIGERQAQTKIPPLIVVCPDQLGPALGRELGPTADLRAFPNLNRPQIIDWVDYQQRIDAVSVEQAVDDTLKAAAGRDLWVVWFGSYKTHLGKCERFVNGLQAERPDVSLAVTGSVEVFEPSNAYLFRATP